jgi:hypothetical protein
MEHLRLAYFVLPLSPLQGQHQWPGKAGSTVFLVFHSSRIFRELTDL